MPSSSIEITKHILHYVTMNAPTPRLNSWVLAGGSVLLTCKNLQRTGSFKIRVFVTGARSGILMGKLCPYRSRPLRSLLIEEER